MSKEALRREIRRLKQQYTPSQLEALSEPVIARLRQELADARTVLAYYSLPDEVFTHQFVDDLVAEGKTVLLPRVVDDTTMELRRYTDRQDMAEGALHIMEPIGERFTDYALIDAVLVPGVAFDTAGHRLGRGRGYYDRFLNDQLSIVHSCVPFGGKRPFGPGSPLLIGLCFDFQIVPSVPVDTNDIPVDTVICNR